MPRIVSSMGKSDVSGRYGEEAAGPIERELSAGG
jgi:hypothetical protein